MLTFGPHVDGFHDVENQVIDHIRSSAREHFSRQAAEKAAVTTVAEFERRRESLRERFLDAIGGLPTERTPLNLECTGRLDRGSYVIEKLIYQSLPQFYVTAALYVPKGIAEPRPAVVFVHGHSDEGKSYAEYQKVCVDLVENGFVVMAVDPPGQGERFQYFDPESGKRIIGGCTTEHTHAGIQFNLGGASVGRHFIWDVMRGIDYLETRDEVDATRIAVTGNSGGGTQSSLLMMSETRLAAAVPCTFMMTLESYMMTGQPQDSEQIIPGAFAHGPDHDDVITMMAPKPVLVGAAAYDFFPIEGAHEAVRRAERVYALYGAEDNVGISVAPTRHLYSSHLRQACVNWLRVHLCGAPGDFVTRVPDILPPEQLWATPNGQVLDLYPTSRTVFDLSRERLSTVCPDPKPIRSATERAAHVARVRADVREVLGVPSAHDLTIYPRIIAESEVDGYACEKLFCFSEPGITVAATIVHPKAGVDVRRTDIVLFENGTSDIPDRREWMEQRLAGGVRLCVFDARGTGAVQTRSIGQRGGAHAYQYKLACDAMMLGGSTLGGRVFDVVRAHDYLLSRDDVGAIGLYGIGRGAIDGYFGAALIGDLAAVELEDMLISYRQLTDTRYYDRDAYNLEIMAYGTLECFDLVDLLPCLGEAAVEFVSPRDATGEALSDDAFDRGFTQVARELGYLRGGRS